MDTWLHLNTVNALQRVNFTVQRLAQTNDGAHLQVFKIMFSNIGRNIVDLDRTEQEAQREYRRTLHRGSVTAESALCVHYQQRHLFHNI